MKIKFRDNITYKWNFEIEKVKKPLSAVKRIGQRFVIKAILNRKVGSARPRGYTIKHDHRLKMTVLKGIRKRLLNTAKIQKEIPFLH